MVKKKTATFTLTTTQGRTVQVPASVILGTSLGPDIGYCLVCGSERYQTEPDARRYPCEDCGRNTVYGAQELLLYVVA